MKPGFLQTTALFGFSAALSLLCGCSTTVNSVGRAQDIGQRQMVDDKRLLTDPSLDRKVRIIGINEATNPNGLLRINVEVLNLRRSLQPFNYRIDWLDPNGMPVETAGAAWIHREILGKETLNLTATAPNPAAKDFRIKFVEDIR